MTHPADRLAFDRAMVTQPVWNRFNTATEAFGLAENLLLHAGPACGDTARITKPVMNSACVAAVYEGLASDFDTAEAMIHAGEIVLKPAQDHGVVTPLAAVVSASMPLHSVYDAWRGKIRAFAPINGGIRPSLRLGLRSEAVLEHIRWLNTRVRDALQAGIGEGIALVPLAVDGLHGGDDCHGFTPVAGAALVEEIRGRSRSGIVDDEVAEFMVASPSLFLNLWMAATKCMMVAAEGVSGSGLITAAGGNGRDCGIQIAGLPGRWFTAPADAPRGDLGSHSPDRALGAIGDSAVVDCFGLGAMAFAHSPAQRSAMADYLPGNLDALSRGLTVGAHPYFRGLDQGLGCSVRQVATVKVAPIISLGILDRNGIEGRIGGGIFSLPKEVCSEAVDALSAAAQ
ncbi:MAG: DUF1116 domain-containing protein [Ruegeria sp.]